MKTILSIFSVLVLAISFQSCQDKCTGQNTYIKYTPVYMSYDDMRASVASQSPRMLVNPGKIYVYGQYLFVNEIDKGIHVINNSNPSNPVNIAFINIPGNLDLAVKGGTLYADNFIDLVAIDISDPSQVNVSKRIESVFPYRTYTNGFVVDPLRGVVSQWLSEEVTEEYDCNSISHGPIWMEGDAVFVTAGLSAGTGGSGGSGSSNASTPSPGLGGSMARFTIAGNYLYTVDNQKLKLFDISTVASPVAGGEASVGQNIETIFPYQDKLFIGSSNGMYIYNISNPQTPVYISQMVHVASCDPVVVDGDYAFVTLRSGTACQGFTNQLEIVDLSNIYSPQSVAVFPMTNPYGLGIDGVNLFICDGESGLKLFDASNPLNVGSNMEWNYTGINTYDVIPFQDKAIVTSSNGIYQFDYSDMADIRLLSKIPIVPRLP